MPDFVETIFDVVVFAAIVGFCVGVSESLRSIALEMKELRKAARREPADGAAS